MKKCFLALIVGLGVWAVPQVVSAAPPGFYAGATYVSPVPATPFAVGPTTTTYNYYAAPNGSQAYSSYSSTPTLFGLSLSGSYSTTVAPYSAGYYPAYGPAVVYPSTPFVARVQFARSYRR